ncbi:LCP family protein [Actinocrispum sp. NPDC049592]|uniref:LCP family protein n=1 Tax=Actinocrispum sp. NPDC049592 TaxID=3154835 RepID=UPI0034386A94
MNAKRVASWIARSVVVLVSAAMLAVSAYAYVTYRNVTTNLATDDVIVSDTPSSSSSSAQAPVRKPAQDVNILLVGIDSRTDNQGHPLPRQVLDALQAGNSDGEQNTDTMMVVHVPADSTKKAFAVSLPRDSYVSIAGGFGMHKLNSAYARGKIAAANTLRNQGKDADTVTRESTTAGRKNLIATVTALTGLHIDHYAEINLFGFSEITNAVGGVPVCLNNPVHDSYSGANFPAGPQTLQGIDALKFVRQRHGLAGGDLDRVRRQQAFLAGLANRMFSAGTLADPGKVSSLVDALTKAVVLDKGWDLLGFAQQLRDLTGDHIEFTTIPTIRPNLPTPSDGVAVEVSPAAVKAFVQNLLDPAPPTPPGEGTPDARKIVVQQEKVQKIANVQPIDAGGIPCVD